MAFTRVQHVCVRTASYGVKCSVDEWINNDHVTFEICERTDRHRGLLITILRNPPGGEVGLNMIGVHAVHLNVSTISYRLSFSPLGARHASRCMPTGPGPIFSACVNFFLFYFNFNDSLETNYLTIYWIDFHQVFTVYGPGRYLITDYWSAIFLDR